MTIELLARNDDLDELRRRRCRVPGVFTRGSWLVAPAGRGGGPPIGPAALQVLLWLPIAADHGASAAAGAPTWAAVAGALGPRGGPGMRTVDPAAVTALLGAEPGLREVARDRWTVHGAEYPVEAFAGGPWQPGWALGMDAGLLVSLVSR